MIAPYNRAPSKQIVRPIQLQKTERETTPTWKKVVIAAVIVGLIAIPIAMAGYAIYKVHNPPRAIANDTIARVPALPMEQIRPYFRDREILQAIHKNDFATLNTILDAQNSSISYSGMDKVAHLMAFDADDLSMISVKPVMEKNEFCQWQKSLEKAMPKIIKIFDQNESVEPPPMPNNMSTTEKYQKLYTDSPAFQAHVTKTLECPHTTIRAPSGAHATKVLVDREGTKIAAIKSKNELLAYRLDHDHFAGVPPVAKGKTAYYLQWVHNATMLSEANIEIETLDPLQLQAIVTLDIRLGNGDRNGQNLLLATRDGQDLLVPIDHDALHWFSSGFTKGSPQFNQPFLPEVRTYIRNLNLTKEAAAMRALDYSPTDILRMKVRTSMLKLAEEHNVKIRHLFYLLERKQGAYYKAASALKSHSERSITHLLKPHFLNDLKSVSTRITRWKTEKHSFIHDDLHLD